MSVPFIFIVNTVGLGLAEILPSWVEVIVDVGIICNFRVSGRLLSALKYNVRGSHIYLQKHLLVRN